MYLWCSIIKSSKETCWIITPISYRCWREIKPSCDRFVFFIVFTHAILLESKLFKFFIYHPMMKWMYCLYLVSTHHGMTVLKECNFSSRRIYCWEVTGLFSDAKTTFSDLLYVSHKYSFRSSVYLLSAYDAQNRNHYWYDALLSQL